MADGAILERQNAKNLNWLHAKIIVTQSWCDSTEILSISHFAIFSNNCHFDWSLLFNFETTQYVNQFDINLVKLQILECQIAKKKKKKASCKIIGTIP